ncbi:hypothetical protein EDC30_102163 [Paucimonas lemoignei]|uniref:Uncharacterized protein n=1 Tax=Paucimonas lemoignei TaxID=29443 RepID=A0A4R3HZU0_PAULE|nr:hypothetical protein [Paucimonas lemoignei]TCS38424.1 hypothetical protein EDC30_102163 [Paucimonas lemoignei]
MDALATLFPNIGSAELWQTLTSIVVAAAVFFVSVYLLRKEEMAEQAEAENIGADIGEVQRPA